MQQTASHNPENEIALETRQLLGSITLGQPSFVPIFIYCYVLPDTCAEIIYIFGNVLPFFIL
jgi:hypothetical protein